MHIPSAPISEITLLGFFDALEKSGHSGEYNTKEWLYVPDFYTEYRYILGTVGIKPLICIGVNPSTAAPNDLDNTLKSVQRIAASNGFDSFTMFNVYAQRATRPEDMDKEINVALHEENMRAFEYVWKNAGDSPAVWAAWGHIIEMRVFLKRCVSDMIDIGKRYGAVWYTAGKRSKKGHPHHPLYLKKDSPLDKFDVITYTNLL